MRVHDHVVLSTAGAALLYPALGPEVLVPWAASLLVDVDHYLYYCVTARDLSLMRAVRFFGQAMPPQHIGTRLLHFPAALMALLALGFIWHAAWLILLGVAFHVTLDLYHAARLTLSRRATLRRDHRMCVKCGAAGPGIVAHLFRQPPLLPSYRLEHFASVCSACHERAHAMQGWRPPAEAPSSMISPLALVTAIEHEQIKEHDQWHDQVS
jgi:hypothetical protein